LDLPDLPFMGTIGFYVIDGRLNGFWAITGRLLGKLLSRAF
jgi:hypothetical protein